MLSGTAPRGVQDLLLVGLFGVDMILNFRMAYYEGEMLVLVSAAARLSWQPRGLAWGVNWLHGGEGKPASGMQKSSWAARGSAARVPLNLPLPQRALQDPRETSAHYLRSSFLVDLLGFLPLDWLALAAAGGLEGADPATLRRVPDAYRVTAGGAEVAKTCCCALLLGAHTRVA